jgi:hypothetical protein
MGRSSERRNEGRGGGRGAALTHMRPSAWSTCWRGRLGERRPWALPLVSSASRFPPGLGPRPCPGRNRPCARPCPRAAVYLYLFYSPKRCCVIVLQDSPTALCYRSAPLQAHALPVQPRRRVLGRLRSDAAAAAGRQHDRRRRAPSSARGAAGRQAAGAALTGVWRSLAWSTGVEGPGLPERIGHRVELRRPDPEATLCVAGHSHLGLHAPHNMPPGRRGLPLDYTRHPPEIYPWHAPTMRLPSAGEGSFGDRGGHTLHPGGGRPGAAGGRPGEDCCARRESQRPPGQVRTPLGGWCSPAGRRGARPQLRRRCTEKQAGRSPSFLLSRTGPRRGRQAPSAAPHPREPLPTKHPPARHRPLSGGAS